jgi:hypothetical protein
MIEKQLSRAHSLLWWQLRVLAVSALTCLSLLAGFVVHPVVAEAAPAFPYGCVNVHCYGRYKWSEDALGMQTTISMVRMTCSGCTSSNGWFVDNEEWLTESGTFQCPSGCWVETGYSEDYPGEQYFWAQRRPGQGVDGEWFGYVAPGDIGGNTTFTILHYSGMGAGNWGIYVGTPTTSYSASSTFNYISPNQVKMGQELYGDSGLSAPTAYFTYNQWEDYNQTFHYQTSSDYNGDDFLSHNPPYAGWATKPQNSSTGGTWYTTCC